MSERFADKLKLVLKVLVVSRTGLASALNVDKSLVGRWVAGTVTPSEHNRVKITRYVADRVPGFTLLDWDRDMDSLSALLGIKPDTPSNPYSDAPIGDFLPKSILEDSKRNAMKRGRAYEGIWKSTRASSDLPGRFVHDICLVQCRKDGRLRVRVGVEGVRYEGWAIFLQHQLFTMACDRESSTMMFTIYNGVARQRPEVLDGLNLATLRDAGGSPAASASVLHRLADLTGNEAADIDLFERHVRELSPLAEEGTIPGDLAKHLTRHVSDGAPGILRILYGQSMARGTLLS